MGAGSIAVDTALTSAFAWCCACMCCPRPQGADVHQHACVCRCCCVWVWVPRLLGPRVLEVVSSTLNRWTSNLVPQWNPYIPKVSGSGSDGGRGVKTCLCQLSLLPSRVPTLPRHTLHAGPCCSAHALSRCGDPALNPHRSAYAANLTRCQPPQGGARVKPGLQGSAASATLATPSARATQSGIPRQVVFLPTCVNRMMGAARGDAEYRGSTLEVFTRLANKAGYQVIVPKVGGGGQSSTELLRLKCVTAAACG